MRNLISTRWQLQQGSRLSRQRGYTLFELLVVLLIITVMLALSGSIYFRSNLSLQGGLICQTIASELRKTRSIAIAENNNRRWIESDLNNLLSEHTSIRDRVTFEFAPNTGAYNDAAFAFYPDGSANGGIIRVVAPKRSWSIHIGLSGRVTIDEERKK